MSFKDLESQVKFELEEGFSWGVEKNKFGGYSIPIVLSEEDTIKISVLAKENKARDPVYKNTLYLKSKNLSDKQKKELFNKGRTNILVYFTVTGFYTKNDVSHLVFKVNKLRKLDKPEDEVTPED